MSDYEPEHADKGIDVLLSKLTAEPNYQDLFQGTSVSLWREDMSLVYLELKKLRLQGIVDLKAYLKQYPDYGWKLSSLILVKEVNLATLKLFKITNQSDFVNKIQMHFGDGSYEVFCAWLIAMWNGESRFQSRTNFIKQTGESFVANISFNLPQNLWQSKNVAVAIIDITDSIQHETRLEAFTRALPSLGVVIDSDGDIQEVLSTPNNLFDPSVTRPVGKNINHLVSPHLADKLQKTIGKTIELQEIQRVELVLTRDSNTVWFDVRMSPLQEPLNQKLAVIMVATDITQQKNLELQLRHSQKLEAISSLSGGIAHELNNLLSPIMGYSDMLLQKSLEPFEQRAVEHILQASVRSSELIKQLMAYSGQTSTVHQDINLTALSQEVIEFLRLTLASNVNISFHAQDEMVTILGVEDEIRQVIINLCTNAQQAMPDGGEIKVQLDIQRRDKTDTAKTHTYVRLRVSDSGHGISIKDMDRIFDPFYSTKSLAENSGLGLSVAQGIMESHGGKIEVVTKVNEGACFTLLFPVLDKSERSGVQVNNPISTVPARNIHVVVIDDEAPVLELLTAMLEQLELKISAFNQPDDVFEAFHKGKIDLLISDYSMPKMNGLDLFKRCQQIQSDIKFILVTGYAEGDISSSIFQSNNHLIMTKPFNMNSLKQNLKTLTLLADDA